MAFYKLEKALYSGEFSKNKNLKLNNDLRVVWACVNEYNQQGKPLVMSAKYLARACGLSPSSLKRHLNYLQQFGLLVRKTLPDNPMQLRAYWAAPLGELVVAMTGDDVSTWASRNSDLQVLPELLPPSMQAQAFAKANKEAPESKQSKAGNKLIDGIWLRYDDRAVVELWKEFLSSVTKARKGFISLKASQWLANELNKATTPQLAALYLSNAIDEGREVISVPAEWQQKKSESAAFRIYEYTLQAIAAKEETRTAEHWTKVVEAGREIFAESFWFPLLERMEQPTESAGVWTLNVLDAEHVGLYESLVDPDFFDVLKAHDIKNVTYNFARLDNVPILRRAGAWKEQHAHFEAVNGQAFDVEAYLKAAGVRGFEHWIESQAIENAFDTNEVDASPAEAVLPWNTESFAGIWDEWKDYREAHFELSFLSIEDEQRALLRMQIHFANEADAYNAIGIAIANGYRSIIQDVQNDRSEIEPTESQKALKELANQYGNPAGVSMF